MLKTLTPEEFNSWKQQEATQCVLYSLQKIRGDYQLMLENASFRENSTTEAYSMYHANAAGRSCTLKEIIDLSYEGYKEALGIENEVKDES